MKADDQNISPTTSSDPIMGANLVPPPGRRHGQHDHHHPATGEAAVTEGISEFWSDLKFWIGRNRRACGIVLGVILLFALYLFWSGQSQQGNSRLWADLEQTTAPEVYQSFADANGNTIAGKIARMELARSQFGPNGIAQLSTRNAEARKKGIENLEKARAAFLALADEFPKDLTMRAEALRLAAEAELALVGIPKADKPQEYRGSVQETVKIYNRLVEVVGESSTVGAWAKKRATDLKAREADVLKVAVTLNDLMTPPPVSDIQPPTNPLTPSGPTGAKPPVTPQEPIKTPTAPLTPATQPATPPPATKPATPPPATKPATPPPATKK
ncbi:MAG: hypothetical protein LC104_04175 [Bacteroidales bacterium]|nr:hypothetical protein [Bacteroidales bacterium]